MTDSRSPEQIEAEQEQYVVLAEVMGAAMVAVIKQRYPEGVRVPIVQSAIGELLTATFESVSAEEDKVTLYMSFCDILRESLFGTAVQ